MNIAITGISITGVSDTVMIVALIVLLGLVVVGSLGKRGRRSSGKSLINDLWQMIRRHLP